jgi:hypothetical protein
MRRCETAAARRAGAHSRARNRSTMRPPDLNGHVHAAVAKHSRRGWRLERPDRSTNIDAVVALAMAVERQAFKPEPVELLGWV